MNPKSLAIALAGISLVALIVFSTTPTASQSEFTISRTASADPLLKSFKLGDGGVMPTNIGPCSTTATYALTFNTLSFDTGAEPGSQVDISFDFTSTIDGSVDQNELVITENGQQLADLLLDLGDSVTKDQKYSPDIYLNFPSEIDPGTITFESKFNNKDGIVLGCAKFDLIFK